MTTYYVDGAVGHDQADGLSEGAPIGGSPIGGSPVGSPVPNGAWRTIQHAMDQVVAGDRVYVKDTGVYAEPAITAKTVGTSPNPIIFEGYTTTPGDLGKVTITSTGGRGMSFGALSWYYIMKNFLFDNHSIFGVDAGNADNMMWFNCAFNNSSSNGIITDNSVMFVHCEARNNGGVGIDADFTTTFIGCIASGNGGDGLFSAGGDLIYRCVSYNNTGDAMDLSSGRVIQCTIDGDSVSTEGADIASSITALSMENIIKDCASIGVRLSASLQPSASFVGYNLMEGNPTNYSGGSGEFVGFSDVSGDPSFVDEAGDDYRVTEDSPAVGAGIVPGGLT